MSQHDYLNIFFGEQIRRAERQQQQRPARKQPRKGKGK